LFDYQYSYNNYKASTIDALVTISTLMMMIFIVWSVLRLYVQSCFYRELEAHIIQVDEQVQMAES
jgi:hypothetical protein